MISFLKRLFRPRLRGAYFGASSYEMKNLLCGIGHSEILKDQIKFSEYPFEPAKVYPNGVIDASEVEWICVDASPPKLKLGNDILFISAEFKEPLTDFGKRNGIKLVACRWNWDWILEPYLDTEFTAENKKRTNELLLGAGFELNEIEAIRQEVGDQMYKYNFDTMLWDWCSLGLSDVLSAMRAKYNETQFRDFYAQAMEIELRDNS